MREVLKNGKLSLVEMVSLRYLIAAAGYNNHIMAFLNLFCLGNVFFIWF